MLMARSSRVSVFAFMGMAAFIAAVASAAPARAIDPACTQPYDNSQTIAAHGYTLQVEMAGRARAAMIFHRNHLDGLSAIHPDKVIAATHVALGSGDIAPEVIVVFLRNGCVLDAGSVPVNDYFTIIHEGPTDDGEV